MLLSQVLLAFIATIGFTILLNAPKNQLIYCGITGATTWLIYYLLINNDLPSELSTFIAILLTTFLSRSLARIRKMPFTIFAIAGIIPLVPGAGIYQTMYHLINNEITKAGLKGIETVKTASIIALAILIVLSIPQKFFLVKNFFSKDFFIRISSNKNKM